MEKSTKTLTREYPRRLLVEPEDLFSFSKKYLENLPDFLKWLKEKEGTLQTLPFARTDKQGLLTKEDKTGFIKKVNPNNGRFCLQLLFPHNENDEMAENDPVVEILVRTDNVLGLVPIHPDFKELNPFSDEPSEKIKDYIEWLAEAIELMKSSVGQKHIAKFFWRYNEEHRLFREGNFHVEGEILEVNKSNVVYEHFRTMAKTRGEERYVSSVHSKREVDRFIAPDRYLAGVKIYPGSKGFPYGFDDGESTEKLVVLEET